MADSAFRTFELWTQADCREWDESEKRRKANKAEMQRDYKERLKERRAQQPEQREWHAEGCTPYHTQPKACGAFRPAPPDRPPPPHVAHHAAQQNYRPRSRSPIRFASSSHSLAIQEATLSLARDPRPPSTFQQLVNDTFTYATRAATSARTAERMSRMAANAFAEEAALLERAADQLRSTGMP